jgi:lipid-binding SYLF domain-containing protein
MKMGEVGLGLGLGVKDFRAVFVFDNQATFNRFVESGWEFGAHADAAAKAKDKGGAVGGEVLIDGITIYQLTESGLALQATIKGTKYWKDDELN